ncbi:MAG: Acyltransferase family protein [Betaproteobacteria bacterium ADurb.Bin341]|nr:MAG: Acyltransferase family protein [Betaproteobacteria bacterium ADurb.Bin341]
MIVWLKFNGVATISAAAFYLFLLAMVIPSVRAWAGRTLSLPYPSTNKEIAALDSYRGGAASLVTMAHIWVFSQPTFNATQQQWWHFLAVGGNKAVPIFVILSGFLIFRAVKNIQTLEDLNRYIKRRFLRIYPVYLFVLLLGYVVGQAVFDLPNFLSQVFMIRSINPVYLKYVNPPSWSLFVEVLFYAVLPIWVVTFRNRLMTAAIVSFVVLLFVDPLASRELWLWKYFFVGIFVSEIVDRYAAAISEKIAIFTFFAGCLLLYLDFQVGPNGTLFDWFAALKIVPKNLAEYSVGLACASSLILIGTLCSPRIARVMSIKPFRVLGAISYSLFLIHPFFILAVFPKFDFTKAGQVQNLVDPVVYAPAWYVPAIMFPGVLVWAIVCFILVERPFLLRRPK